MGRLKRARSRLLRALFCAFALGVELTIWEISAIIALFVSLERQFPRPNFIHPDSSDG